jgi:predicted transcriptional regulator
MCAEDQERTARLFDVLADECARRILCSIACESRSPSELVDRCEKSAATVYRRLRTLCELDLVRQRPACGGDGRQRAYVLAVESVDVSFREDGLEVDVSPRETDDALELAGRTNLETEAKSEL